MLKVTKFGGSSLCDSAGFSRVREIVLADPARRVVVVSRQAAARRRPQDHGSSLSLPRASAIRRELLGSMAQDR